MIDILNELKSIISSNLRSIEEIGIFYESNSSLSTIMFSSNQLGISILIIKDLFRFSYTYFYKCYLSKRNLSILISSETATSIHIFEEFMDIVTIVLLMVKGDIHSVVNCRKEMLSQNIILYDNEIYITSFLIRKNSKSPSLWQHRRFCIDHISREQNSSYDLKKELSLCEIVAEQSAKNYYAWVHRLWTIQLIFRQYINDKEKSLLLTTFVSEEFIFIDKWLLSHISDHSAVNHQIHFINLIIKSLFSSNNSNSCQFKLEIPNNLLLCKFKDKINIEEQNIINNEILSLYYFEYVGESIMITNQIDSPIKLLLQRLLWLECLLIYREGGCESLWLLRRALFSIYLNKLILSNQINIIHNSIKCEKKIVEKIKNDFSSSSNWAVNYYQFIIMEIRKLLIENNCVIDILNDLGDNDLLLTNNKFKR